MIVRPSYEIKNFVIHTMKSLQASRYPFIGQKNFDSTEHTFEIIKSETELRIQI